MKKSIFMLVLLVINFIGNAQIPSYYSNSDIDLTGQNLLRELSELITDTHTTFLSYTPGIWTTLQESDRNPSNNAEVILLYGYNDNDSNIINDRARGVNDNGGNSDDWNREHVFPKSLGSPNLGTTGPGADAHHIRPADVSMNSNRSNRKFADGSGNASITSNGYWYPGDEWKGDVARMIMFMYLRYEDRCLPDAVGIGNRLSTDSNMLDLFLKWNVEDPVSNFELQRNNAIESIQGNRNPFIDNPAFATTIWGGDQAEDLFGNVSTIANKYDLLISEYVEGSSNNKAIEIANISSSSINLSDYSLRRDTNGSGTWSTALSLSGTLASGNVYVIANNNASSSLKSITDQTSTSSVLSFNGNDPVGLFYNDVLIDIVGVFGGGSRNNFALNSTLVRDSNANATKNYNSAEWTAYGTDTYSYLGSHDSTSSGGGSATVFATLTIIFDRYSSETSWEIVNDSNTNIYSGSGYSFSNETSTSINIILNSNTCYSLNFYDSYGDGICCANGNGSYKLTNNSNGNTLISGGSFGSTDSNDFCVSSSAKSLANEMELALAITKPIDLIIYPNPTSKFVQFSTDHKTKNANYIIYNQAGAEVKKGMSTQNSISIEALSVGLYFIKINNLPIMQFIKN